MSAAGLLEAANLTQAEFVRGLERVLRMDYVVEVVENPTKKVIKRLGPMTERKADKLVQSLKRSLDEDKYFVRVFKVPNELLEDTQDE